MNIFHRSLSRQNQHWWRHSSYLLLLQTTYCCRTFLFFSDSKMISLQHQAHLKWVQEPQYGAWASQLATSRVELSLIEMMYFADRCQPNWVLQVLVVGRAVAWLLALLSSKCPRLRREADVLDAWTRVAGPHQCQLRVIARHEAISLLPVLFRCRAVRFWIDI